MTTVQQATAVLPSVPADTPTTRCDYYRRECGLDAHVRPDLQAIIVTTSARLGAVTMPAQLAAHVRLHLQRNGIRPSSIVSHPRSSRWTWLVRPDTPDDPRTYARLFRLQVALARPGTEIRLPSPGRRHAEVRCWTRQPSKYRQSGAAVLAAVYACTGSVLPAYGSA